jgi:hypothetical protein
MQTDNTMNTSQPRKRKKIYFYILFIISLVLLIPFIAFMALHSIKIQKIIADRLLRQYTQKTGIVITFESIEYSLFNKLTVKNIYISDLEKDTLLFTPNLSIDIKSLNIKKKQLVFKQIEVVKPIIHLNADSNKQINLIKVLNKLSSGEDSVPSMPWKLKFQNITFENANVKLHRIISASENVNLPPDIILCNLILRIKNLNIEKGSVTGRVNRFCFNSNVGLELKNLSSSVEFNENKLSIEKLNLLTANSDVEIKSFTIDLNETASMDKFPFTLSLNSSYLESTDWENIFPKWQKAKLHFELKGEIKGNRNDLNVKNFNFKTAQGSFFKGQFHITQLQNVKEPYLYISSKKLNINTLELRNILSCLGQKLDSDYSSVLYKVKNIQYEGNFTGFFSDFVTFGTITTPLGAIRLDIAFKPHSKENIEVNGTIETSNLEIGTLFNVPQLIGPTDLTLVSQGYIAKNNDIKGNLTLTVNHTSINSYPLQNITAKGKIENKTFVGSASIDDNNLIIETSGEYTFLDSFPKFNFIADIRKINLQSLRILPDDSINSLSAKIKANFQGNSAKEFDGAIEVSDLIMNNIHSSLKFNKITISALNNENKKETIINTAYFDIKINGNYFFSSIQNDINYLLLNYFPSSFTHIPQKPQNDFSYKIMLKNTKPILNFFYPSIDIADSTSIEGKFQPEKNNFYAEIASAYLRYNSIQLENPILSIQTKDTILKLTLKTELSWLGENIPLSKLSSDLTIFDNAAEMNFSWLDSLSHQNTLKFKADSILLFEKRKALDIMILPTSIYIMKGLWNMNASRIVIDSSLLKVDRFSLTSSISKININGKISKNINDTLFFNYKELDISTLNFLLKTNSFKFSGTTDGTFSINDYFGNRKITGIINLNNFEINNEDLGKLQLNAQWNANDEKIYLNLKNINTPEKLSATGSYNPQNSQLSFNFNISDIGLKIIEPIISPTFSVNDGKIKGKAFLSGLAQKPVLSGELAINHGELALNIMHTKYKFNNTLTINNNNFFFKNFMLYDETEKPLLVNGTVRNSYLKNFAIDFLLEANNNLVFNKPAPNDLPFYGKGFASGKIHIFGPTDQIKVDITQAKTENNSEILIALGQSSYSAQNNFIEFISPTPPQPRTTYFKPTSITNNSSQNSRLTLNMDLEVTPQAEVQIIFSPQYGDVLKGRGQGSLKLEIDEAGNFLIRGDYTFTEGVYNFTMNNLINKKFEIQNNSSIIFNGHPENASLDILAEYHTRAPLYNLFGEANMEYKNRIPVDCQLYVLGKLLSPDIRLSLDFPNSTEETKSRIRSVINTDQEMSQQFLSLLMLNNFMPTTTGSLQTKLQETNIGRDVATTTSIEILSSQLSSWMSNLSKNLDIGVNYRPGDQVYSNEDLEIALSTQLLNNRMSINTNIDIMGGQSSTSTTNPNQSSNLVGDVNVEYKLTDRLSLKAFNRANDIIYYQDYLYTQGIGLIYREDFANLKDLTAKYFKEKQQKNKKDK